MAHGRADLADALDEILGRCAVGAGATVVVHGEPGSGRTALCRDVAERWASWSVHHVGNDVEDAATIVEAVRGTRFPQRALVVVDDAERLTASVRAQLLDGARTCRSTVGVVALLTTADPGALGLAPDDAIWLELVPLDVAEIGAIVEARSGVRGCEGAVRKIASLSNGNMRTVVEIAGVVGRVQLETGHGIDSTLLASLPRTRLVASHLRSLPPTTQDAVVVAALGHREPTDTVARALTCLGRSLADLAPAERAAWIEIDTEHVRFRHELDRIAASTLPPFERRRAALDALAEATRSVPPDRSAWYEAQRTTGVDELLADRLHRLAGAELAASRPLFAAEIWQAAAKLRGARVARDLLRAGRAAHEGGAPDVAAELARAVVAGDATPGERAEARRLQGAVLTWRGHPDTAYELLAGEAEQLADIARVEAVALLMQATTGALHCGHLAAAAELAGRAAELATGLGPMSTAAHAIAGYVCALRGDPAGLTAITAAVGLHHAVEPMVTRTPAALVLTSWAGRMLSEAGAGDAALEMLTWTIEQARRAGLPTLELMPLAHRTSAHLRRSEHRKAAVDSAHLTALADQVGGAEHRATAELLAGRVALLAGDERAHERLRRVAALSTGPAQLDALCAIGQAALASGDVDEAIVVLDRVESTRAEIGLLHPGFLPYRADLVEGLVRAGDDVRAVEVAAEQLKSSDDWPDPLVLGLAARSAALVADDPDVAEENFDRAIAYLVDADARFEQARTMLCLGEHRRRRRRPTSAREPLRAAVHLFQRLGAPTWAERAIAELRAAGAPDHATRPAEGERLDLETPLTDQEWRIARAVAAGATNREAAAALHLSPKTVENHLSRIYAKLHVRTRTGLARRLDLAAVIDSPHP